MKKLVRTVTSVILLACMTAATVFGSAGVESSDLDLIAQNSYQQQAEISASVDSKITVTVPKKVVLDASESSITCKVNAKGDLEGNKKLIVEPEITKFYLKSSGKSDVEASISQESTEWNWSELATKDASGSVIGKDTSATITYGTLTAGVWKSSFNYNINIVDDAQEPETEIEVDFELPTEAGIYSISGEKIADITAEQLSDATFKYDADVMSRANAVVIPDGATLIAYDKFANFQNLKMVRIPDSVTSLGTRAFKDTALTEVVFEGNIENVNIVGDTFANTPYESSLFNEDGLFINGNTLVSGSRASGVVNIPNGISKIATAAFEHNQNITEVNFPKSIKNIDSWSFADCGNLAALKFDAECSGITIGDAAFWEGIEGDGYISDTNSISYVEYPSDSMFDSISRYAFPAASKFCKHKYVRVVVDGKTYTMPAPFEFGKDKTKNSYQVRDGVILGEKGNFIGTTDEVGSYLEIEIPKGYTSMGIYVPDNYKEFDGVETISIKATEGSLLNLRGLGATETLKTLIIGDKVAIDQDESVNWPSSLENIVVSSNALINCSNDFFSGVKHVEYHGTDPDAPWGADSMN